MDLLVKRIASSTCLSIITAVVIHSFIAPKLSSQGGNPRTGNPSPARSGNAKVDELFAKWNRSDSPGCSVAISKNGALVYERGYGIANLELGVPITAASIFNAASISKQFTAMSIMLLAQRGQLSLDDDVGKYIPNGPLTRAGSRF